jgi:SAM-dependent methyltransferase
VAADTAGRAASLVQRLYAAGYDRLFDRVDPVGGADHRRRLVEQATGAVLEIGAGTGRNLPRYRTATRVVALEPGPGMRARANHAAQAARVPVEVIDGTAEHLPFPDAAFDTVVASLVLCTVPDLAQTLAEASRVLWPPSPPPGSTCWSWTGSTSRSCPRWSAPTSSGWPSGPSIPPRPGKTKPNPQHNLR